MYRFLSLKFPLYKDAGSSHSMVIGSSPATAVPGLSRACGTKSGPGRSPTLLQRSFLHGFCEQSLHKQAFHILARPSCERHIELVTKY